MTTIQITGNNNFKFITNNYDPGLVNSINGANNNIKKNEVRNIINGITTAHPQIANIDEFKKEFYTSPFINMSQGATVASEESAYNGLLTYGLKTNLFDIKPAYLCNNRNEMDSQLKKVVLKNERMLVTGKGRVGKGILETNFIKEDL